MKQKGKTKRLLGTLAIAATLVAAAGGLIGLNNDVPVASADTTGLEVTHLTGMRSNTPRIYWRIDETEYSDFYQLASDVECKYTNATGDVTAKVDIGYAKAGGNAGPGVTSAHDSGTQYPCLYFLTDQTEAAGDTVTIPSGTILKGNDGVDKYYLDQDYTFVYNGGWTFDESSQKIPVGFTGVSNGGRGATYFTAYCDDLLAGYYPVNTALSTKASAEYVSSAGETTALTLTLKYMTTSNNIGDQPTIQVQGFSSVSVAEGEKIVLKAGTTVFDNFTFDRDYTFTYIGTNCGVSGCWSMSATTNENDPETTLTVRGGASNFLNLFMPKENPCTPTSGQQYFNMNGQITVNGELKYIQRMHGLPMSGSNYSFGLEFGANYTAKENDIITFEKGAYILGYRVAGTTLFKFNGSAWSVVACDGSNHIFNDAFTCHDRTCACGHVEKATTDHTFEDGTFACQERVCTTCGDSVAAVAHTIPDGKYECTGYTCSVCSAAIAADESKHVKEGEGCDVSCANCGTQFSSHEYPATPDGGWVKGDTLLTVTEEPTCTETGKGTVNCTVCGLGSTEVVVNALGHSVPNGDKYCERTGCDYRIPYTADDMAEVLALENLTEYTYGDSHVEDEDSVMGRLDRTPTAEDANVQDNNFLINTVKKGEKEYEYVSGKEGVHNMMVSFSINLTDWAGSGRSSYVWLNAHENGSFGIGFQFCFYNNAQNLRVQYKSTDGKEINVVAAKALTGFALNAKQSFKVGAVQNSDGSFFVFAYYNDELFLTGTLTNKMLEDYKNEATHNGLGGAVAFRFHGSASALAPVGSICDLEHSIEGTQYACKEYACKVCSAKIAATEDHSWGDGVSNGNGSCTVKEEFTRTCGTCGDTTTYEGDYVHTWDTENPIVVTEAACNNVDKVVKYECTSCDVVSDNKTLIGTGIEGAHNFVYEDVTEGTCVTPGTEQGTCSKCNEKTEISDTVVNKNGHSYGTEIAEAPATCTENGTAAHYVCSLCNKLFTEENGVYTEVTADDLVIEAGHPYVFVAAVTATADADGVKEHYKCSVCDKLFVKDGEVYVETTEEALKVAYVAPQTSDDSTTSDSVTSDDSSASEGKSEENGCGSSISSMSLLALLTVCGGALAVARRKEN